MPLTGTNAVTANQPPGHWRAKLLNRFLEFSSVAFRTFLVDGDHRDGIIGTTGNQQRLEANRR